MVESLITRLESLYTNNEVNGYLAVRIVGETISPGWLETGILSKGLSGSLGSKPNQMDYVIPLSASIKAVIDRGLSSPGDRGILLYGESGLMDEKFVVCYSNGEPSNGELTREFVAFRITNYSPHDVMRLVLKYGYGVELSGEIDEPDVDYVDFLNDSVRRSESSCGFSVHMPSNWANPRGWIPDILKQAESEGIIFKHGTIQDCIIVSLLMSNWVIQMVENLLIKDPLAACLFQRDETIESFFWDGPRDILTITINKDESLESLSTNVLIPLWSKSDEFSIPPSKTKEVVVQERTIKDFEEPSSSKGLSKSEQKILSNVEWLLRDVDINDTMRRIERAEAILSELQRVSKEPSETPLTEKNDFLDTRLKDTIDRLDSLNERLSSLETRIQKICDELR